MSDQSDSPYGTPPGGGDPGAPSGPPYGQPSHGQPPHYGGQPPYGGQPQPPQYGGQPGYGQPPQQQWGQPPQYGQQPYPPQQFGQPPYAGQQGTNGMAIASLVLGILWLYWVGSVLALIFGYQARKKIKQTGESGAGMATAGIVLGWIGVATLVLMIGFFLFVGMSGGFEDSTY